MSEPELSPETILQIAPDVRMRFDSTGHLLIDSPTGTVVDAGPRGFAIVALFAQPIALGAAIARLELQEPGSTDFAQTMGVVNLLLEEAALVLPAADRGQTSGWADPLEHARMLHDSRRTGDYLTAIAAAVRPGDVVLDIGTGSGVLAVAAARAGARHVYAIEASDIASVAERVFAVNGVADRVTLVPGWSRQVDLPELADLLVSEIIGSEPLEEEILETTLDARRRLLSPGARLLPHTLTLIARPLLIPEADMRQRAIGSDAVRRWQMLYGIDFQPLLDAAPHRPIHVPTEGEVAAAWPQVGPPVALASINLATFERASLRASAGLVIDDRQGVNAVAITFRAGLFGDIEHTFDPWRWPVSSWGTSVWVLPVLLSTEPDQTLRIEYRRRIPGEADGLRCQVVSRVRDPR